MNISMIVNEPVVQDAVSKVKETASNSDKLLGDFKDWIFNAGIKIILALVILFVGKKLIKMMLHTVHKVLDKSNMEGSVTTFLLAVTKAVLYAILISVLINTIGIDTTPLVAVIGTATLSIGLALQGSLSNFAGGVLILIMKPFRVGDYIITPDREGEVTGLDIFYTRMLTNDNRLVVIPNGILSNSSIINVTHEPVRRLDLSVSIDYSEDIKKVKDILESIAYYQDYILKDRDITVFVNSFDPSAINIGIRVWVNTEDYWTSKWDMLEKIKQAFDANDVTIPFDQLDVNVTNRQ